LRLITAYAIIVRIASTGRPSGYSGIGGAGALEKAIGNPSV
jgi:hypothetical protein